MPQRKGEENTEMLLIKGLFVKYGYEIYTSGD